MQREALSLPPETVPDSIAATVDVAHMLLKSINPKRAAGQAHDLGHANIQNTTRYTALAEGRFKGFWRD
jgi:hypothetical protein